jgi:DNA recombination-dependent growth factor C
MTITTTATDLDATIEFVVTRKAQIKRLQEDLDQALDALRQAVDDGDLDPQFQHNDAKFDLRPGRVSYDYPPAVTSLSIQLKDAQAAAVADGTATQKRGEPFWVVKLP